MDFRCSLSPNMRCRGRICWWVTFILCVCCWKIYRAFVNRTLILLYLFCFSCSVCLTCDVFLFVLFHPPTARSNSICGLTDVCTNRHLSPCLVAFGRSMCASWIYPCCVVFVCHLWFRIISQPTYLYSLSRCHGLPMLAVLQYALSWLDLLVCYFYFLCFLLENIT